MGEQRKNPSGRMAYIYDAVSDGAAIAIAAREGGATIHGTIPQGEFLTRLGIETRAAQLLAKATRDQATDIKAARTRLIDKEQMGYLFKVMAITPRATAAPPAFEETTS